jgi:3-oxoadipate enol-lactonase
MTTRRVHYELVGQGEPLFLLNGIMMSTASWAKQRPVFSKHYRCILHDFRGQLRSPRPPVPFTMQLHVDDLLWLFDELQIESAHLAGTSYGGEVGMLFAAAHPRRVRSLSVISCVPRIDATLRAGVQYWADAARTNPAALLDVTLPYNYSPAFLAANPGFIDAARERVMSMPPQWFDAFADLCEAFMTLDVPLERIQCPTLVLCGADDVLKPPHFSREIADGIAGARLQIIENAGHAMVIERADAVNQAVLDFLASLRS